jgi:hypothetical protein
MLHQWHMLSSSVTEEYDHAGSSECYPTPNKRLPWNKGKLIGAKPPLQPKHVWSIRTKLQIEGRAHDLAMFNLAIDNKLRGCNPAHERPLCAAKTGPSSKVTFDPRCRGLCGSHKQASMLVANVNRPLSASSLSQSRCLNFQNRQCVQSRRCPSSAQQHQLTASTLVNGLLRRRRIRLPRRFRCRARCGSHLDGVATLQCLGWTIDHRVLRR